MYKYLTFAKISYYNETMKGVKMFKKRFFLHFIVKYTNLITKKQQLPKFK